MSQQLKRLEARCQATTDPAYVVELSARIAIILARLGRFQDANTAVKVLRKDHGDWRSGRLHVWIMLSEAVIDWYENLSYKALDRVTRVQVLSEAMGYHEMFAIASAWRAHIQFESSDFNGMYKSINSVFENTTVENADANVRVAIVLSSAFALCGDLTNAHEWFVRGRAYALSEGDQASVEALQYNRAVLSLTCIRAESCTSAISQDRLRSVRTEIDSSRNLHLMTRISALANHLRLAEARLLILESQFVNAACLLGAVRNEGPFASYHFSQDAIDLDITYCKFRLGAVEDAYDLFSTINLSSLEHLDVDDKLMCSKICLEMTAADPRFGEAQKFIERKTELRRQYLQSRAQLEAGLHPYDAKRPLG